MTHHETPRRSLTVRTYFVPSHTLHTLSSQIKKLLLLRAACVFFVFLFWFLFKTRRVVVVVVVVPLIPSLNIRRLRIHPPAGAG